VKIPLIILTYNNLNIIHPLVSSLEKNTYAPYRVIFVDNGSTDGTLDYLKQVRARLPYDVVLLQLPKNLGVSKGWNVGIRWIRKNMSEAKYVGFINSDIILEEGWLIPMRKVLEEQPKAGMVDNVLYSAADRTKVVSDGPTDSPDRGAFPYRGSSLRDFTLTVNPAPVHWGTFACALVRMEAFDEIGIFDERFLIYSSDFDIQIRLKLHGYEIWHCPGSQAYHMSFVTCAKVRATEPKIAFYMGEDGKYLFKKWGNEITRQFKENLSWDINYALKDIHGVDGDYSPRDIDKYEELLVYDAYSAPII
jgi:GT2 family glycosyltransferase